MLVSKQQSSAAFDTSKPNHAKSPVIQITQPPVTASSIASSQESKTQQLAGSLPDSDKKPTRKTESNSENENDDSNLNADLESNFEQFFIIL